MPVRPRKAPARLPGVKAWCFLGTRKPPVPPLSWRLVLTPAGFSSFPVGREGAGAKASLRPALLPSFFAE